MIDTHCHLFNEYYENIEEVIFKMKDHKIIVSGVDDETNREVLQLISKYPNVYGCIGLHPENLESVTSASLSYIEKNLKNPKIVAIGEIGLDYYYSKENQEAQKKLFQKQILLAQKYHKPIVVHSREASQDTYELLKKYGKGLKVDIHCFSGSVEMAKEYIKLGCRLGIGGVLTFKNSKTLPQVVKEVDLTNLLLETDSPFLTPEPFRGKQNEPYNVIYVAQKIADIKGISLEEVLSVTTQNALLQFDLPS